MQRLVRLACIMVLGALAPLLGACAYVSDFGAGGIKMPNAGSFNMSSYSFTSRREDFALGPPAAGELLSPEGRCSSVGSAQAAADATAAGLVQGGIALQMTECDVVRRAGAPDKIEYPSNRFERTVVLTFIRGPRPGVYSFTGGRLVSIERGPEPPAPPKPAKKPGRA
jgi:hypothetical protein